MVSEFMKGEEEQKHHTSELKWDGAPKEKEAVKNAQERRE